MKLIFLLLILSIIFHFGVSEEDQLNSSEINTNFTWDDVDYPVFYTKPYGLIYKDELNKSNSDITLIPKSLEKEPPDPEHENIILKGTNKRAKFNRVILAESDDFILRDENLYFPDSSIKNWQYFSNSSLITICPYKGEAHYYDITVDGNTANDSAWYFPEPKEGAEPIKFRLAFDSDMIEIKDVPVILKNITQRAIINEEQEHENVILKGKTKRVKYHGIILAESDDLVLRDDAIYFPESAVRKEYLSQSNLITICPYKGETHYYDITINDTKISDSAWYFPQPKEGAEPIKDRIAFNLDYFEIEDVILSVVLLVAHQIPIENGSQIIEKPLEILNPIEISEPFAPNLPNSPKNPNLKGVKEAKNMQNTSEPSLTENPSTFQLQNPPESPQFVEKTQTNLQIDKKSAEIEKTLEIPESQVISTAEKVKNPSITTEEDIKKSKPDPETRLVFKERQPLFTSNEF